MVYQKLGTVFGNVQNFPKQELSKINYNLFARYLAYELDEEEDTQLIIQKVIKRINFFSEEFPFKLKKLDKIIKSGKIFAFGYDLFARITFYIKPFSSFNILESIDKLSINEVYASQSLENIDYIIYMFFIIECVLPTLRQKHSFSDQINIIIDFSDQDVDTELIRFIMTYFHNYNPLLLAKVHVVNFEFQNLKKNISFRNELDNLDIFRVNLKFNI